MSMVPEQEVPELARRAYEPTVTDVDIAALALPLMTNTAVTGVTFDFDGGQQLVEG